VDIFRVVCFVQDMDVRMSGTVTLFEEFHSMRNVMDRVLGDFKADDNLSVSTEIDVFRNCFRVLPFLQE
jgi:hypothetical protein